MYIITLAVSYKWKVGPTTWKEGQILCPVNRGCYCCCRNTYSKVMLKVRLNKLKPQAEKIIAEEQAGIRAGGSTTEQIFNLRILCEKYLQHQQNLYHVFIDFKKAFDRVWHAALWATMKKYISTNLQE